MYSIELQTTEEGLNNRPWYFVSGSVRGLQNVRLTESFPTPEEALIAFGQTVTSLEQTLTALETRLCILEADKVARLEPASQLESPQNQVLTPLRGVPRHRG